MYTDVRASLVGQLVKNPLSRRRPRFSSWVGKISWRRDRLPTPVFMGFPGGSGASLVAQTVKHLPTVQETWTQSLCWEDLLEKEMATHSSILAWKIPWTEELGRLQSMGVQELDRLSDFTFFSFSR